MPEPLGKEIVTSGFFDSAHASCLMTRQSTTCVYLFVNGTIIRWFSKRQNTVETSTYGSEMVAGRIAVDLAVELRYNLHMLGAQVKGATYLFGDKQSMVTNTLLSHSTLKKRQSANNYHRVRQAVVSKIVNIIDVDMKFNLSDMGTKHLPGPTHHFLLKNQQFPPVSTAGECKKERKEQMAGDVKFVTNVLSPLDKEVALALEDKIFRMAMIKLFISEGCTDNQDNNGKALA